MKKIKILHFPVANSKGGVTRYALNIWREIDKNIFQCDFATLSPHLDFEKELVAGGSRVHYISCYAEVNEKQFASEFRTILEQGYDVVNIYTSQWKGLLVEKLCMECQIPKVTVYALNGGIDVISGKACSLEEARSNHEKVKAEFNESYATDFCACSNEAADFLFGEQISRDKIRIIPVPIDLERYKFNDEVRNLYRKEYGLDGCFVIGHVGRFVYQKNHEFLINVFYEVTKHISSARLLLLGTGKLISEVKSQVKKLGIEDKVIFLGKLEADCDWWYQAMDVFCLPSRFEGLPAVLIEAQASYLPCVYSDLITAEAAINDNVCHIPLKVDEWKEKLIRLSEEWNDDIRKKCASKGIRALQNRGCDIKSEIKNIENEYYGAGENWQ